MSMLIWLAAALSVVGSTSVSAQTPNLRPAGSEPDFSGVYDGARSIAEPETFPFTAEGKRAHESYDPIYGDPRQADDCAPESVPAVLWAGTISNMQFVQHDDSIELRYEHGGTVRSIRLDGKPPAADEPHTPLGYSVGRWEGPVLSIETTHLAAGVIFTTRGYPISRDARITERYTRDAEKNLDMELVVYDPVNYTQPVLLGREWIWSPEEEVLPWNCVSLGPRDEEPDIDAIRQLLNDL